MITGKVRCILDDDGDIQDVQFVAADGTLWSRFMGPGAHAGLQGLLRLDESRYEDDDSVVLDKELTLDRWLVLTTDHDIRSLVKELGINDCIKGLKMLKLLEEAYDRCSGVCEGCPIGTFCDALANGLKIQSWYCDLQDMKDSLNKRLEEALNGLQ